MSDPTLALQAVIVAALKGNSAVQALVGTPPATVRVYDAVPENAPRPYISIGQPDVLPDRASCLRGAEVTFPIHGWASGPQSVVIKQLGQAILAALDEVILAPTGHHVVVWQLEQMRYLDDPDPLIKHVFVSFRGLTEPQ